MRIARAHGRLVIIDGGGVVDAAAGSGGEFSADPDRVFAVWDRFTEWAGGYAGPGAHTGPLVPGGARRAGAGPVPGVRARRSATSSTCSAGATRSGSR